MSQDATPIPEGASESDAAASAFADDLARQYYDTPPPQVRGAILVLTTETMVLTRSLRSNGVPPGRVAMDATLATIKDLPDEMQVEAIIRFVSTFAHRCGMHFSLVLEREQEGEPTRYSMGGCGNPQEQIARMKAAAGEWEKVSNG